MTDERTDDHPFDWYPEPVTDAERVAFEQHGEDGARTLAQISQARRMLAEAKELTDIKAIRDMAKAARTLAEAVGLSREAVNEASEVQLRAERMAGELLREMDKAKGHRFTGDSRTESPVVSPPRLRDIGITPKQSMNWQAAASVPAPAFERHLAETKAAGEPLTTAGVVQVARKIERERRTAEPKPIVEPGAVSARIEASDARNLPLDDETVDLIVTSPPYGLNVDYDCGDVDPDLWPTFMAAWLEEAWRVTKWHGRLALNAPLDVSEPYQRPTYVQAVAAALEAGWLYQATLTWHEGNTTKGNRSLGSVNSSARPHPVDSSEMIAIFSKGEWGPSSTSPDDITPDEWQEAGRGPWVFSGESRPWEDHPAAFPERLPHLLIRYLCRVGDTVLDPFVGSGTTALAALELGRQAIGFDRSQQYVDSTLRRLATRGGGERSGALGETGAGASLPMPGQGEVLAGGLRGRLHRGLGGAQGAEHVEDGQSGVAV